MTFMKHNSAKENTHSSKLKRFMPEEDEKHYKLIFYEILHNYKEAERILTTFGKKK